MTNHNELNSTKQIPKKEILKRFMQVLIQILLFALLLMVSADKLEWIWAWIYIGIQILIVGVNAFILPYDIVVERGKSKKNVKKWDRVIMTLNFFPAIGLLVVAGLDTRFGWTMQLNIWIQVAALVVMILGNAFFTWSMVSNHFFSTAVRIQLDRSHKVATGGPYNYVRHPGYIGFIIINLVTPLVLGSLWALIPGFIMAILFITRTNLEDRTLQNELEGYKVYADKVKYKLLPGIW